jgi:hypothetical protein
MFNQSACLSAMIMLVNGIGEEKKIENLKGKE